MARPSNLRALIWFLGLSSCSQPQQPTTAASQSQASAAVGVLHSPTELGADFQWRQQVIAHWPTGTRTFDAVLSKEGSTLLLIGLGPMDTPGFVLRIDDNGELSVENNTGQPMPFDAKFVLLDVQRAFYPWFPAPSSEGARTTTRDGETIMETWQGGHLTERQFTRVDGRPQGAVKISYEGWVGANRAPKRVTLRNGWYGYTLVVETLEQANLD